MLQNCDRPSPLLSPAFHLPSLSDIKISDHSAMNTFSTLPAATCVIVRDVLGVEVDVAAVAAVVGAGEAGRRSGQVQLDLLAVTGPELAGRSC